MDYYCDDIFDFKSAGPYYEIHAVGLDGECFTYSVYFTDGFSEERLNEVKNAVGGFTDQYQNEDDYPGYISVSEENGKALIYLDLGGVEDCDRSIYGIIRALNNVKGIERVILNEDSEPDF